MIIVTGASKGLGKAISSRLVEAGHEVCGLARNISNIDMMSYECDVSSYSSVKSVAKKLKQKKSIIKAVVNAAGSASMNLALTTPPNVTKELISTNLMGTIFCCQLFAPLLIRSKGGSIINFSTVAVSIGLKGESIYVASKAGVEAFSRSFAREVADFNIRVNCIAPGPIETDLIKGVNSQLISDVVKKQVIPRQFEKQDVCDIVESLLDKKLNTLSGQVLHIGGI